MNLSNASKVELDNVLNNCGWRQTKQRIVLLKSIFDGTNKHFSINQINDVLKENRSYSKTKSEDEILIDTFDLVHQEAFSANKPIIENPSAAKAFLGDETKQMRQFVKAFEENRYKGFEEDNIWKMKETNIHFII